MVTRPLTTGRLSQAAAEQYLSAVWRQASRIIDPAPDNAALAWSHGIHHAIDVGVVPPFIETLESWLTQSIESAVRRFADDVGAERVVTVLSWSDYGVTVPDERVADWQALVRREWHRTRTAWLLVSGCGHPGPGGALLHLVYPYRDVGNWDRFRREARKAPPWRHRKPSMVFRGATTGDVYDIDEHTVLTDLPRSRLMLALRDSGLPHDSAFTTVVHVKAGREEAVTDALRSHELLDPTWVPEQDQMGHRYQLLVDGHHGAWEAHVWKLLSGSTCFWVESSAINWYDGFFEPWVHYVPVRPDGGDLIERYREIREDDRRAQRMAASCRRRANRVFRARFMFRAIRSQWLATWDRTLESND